MLDTNTSGFFRLGSYGFGCIANLAILTPLNRMPKRYVTYQVFRWTNADCEGTPTLLTIEGVTRWFLKVDTDITRFEQIEARCIDQVLTAVLGKGTLPNQDRLKWQQSSAQDTPITRLLQLDDTTFASCTLSQIKHTEVWDRKGTELISNRSSVLSYHAVVNCVHRQGVVQLPPTMKQTEFQLERYFKGLSDLREKAQKDYTERLQMALKLPVGET